MFYSLLQEKTSHEIGLDLISTVVADYIVNDYIPSTKKLIRSKNTVTDSKNPYLEFCFLSGEKPKNGYLGGEEIDVNQYTLFVFDTGKVGNNIPDNIRSKIDSDVYESIKNCKVCLEPISSGIDGYFNKTDKTVALNILTMNNNNKWLKSKIKTNLVHEFRHFLDSKMSKGKAKFHYYDDTQETVTDAYLKNPAEANARFSQATSDMISKLKREKNNTAFTKEEFIKYVDLLFRRHNIKVKGQILTHNNKQYSRFFNRALNLYDEIRGTK